MTISGGRTLYVYEFEEAPPVEPARDSEDDG